MSDVNINKKGWKYKWEEWEDEIIKKYYPANGYLKVLEFLPNRNKQGIQSRASRLGISYLTYNENYFSNIDTANKSYWLGFIFTDGYVTTENRWGMEICLDDIYHMKNFMKELSCNINIKTRIRNKFDKEIKSCSFQIKNKKMYEDLIHCGVIPNKTDMLKFPFNNILLKKYYHDFIRGLFDGDGSFVFYSYEHIRKDRNNKKYNRIVKEISFVCKSESFIKDLKDIIYKECGANFALKYNPKNNLPTLRLSKSDDMIKFINYIYSDVNNSDFLKRKYLKAQEILRYCLA